MLLKYLQLKMQCTKYICNKKKVKKKLLCTDICIEKSYISFFFSIFTLVLMCVIAQNKNLKCQIVHVDDYYQQNPPSSNHDNLFFLNTRRLFIECG